MPGFLRKTLSRAALAGLLGAASVSAAAAQEDLTACRQGVEASAQGDPAQAVALFNRCLEQGQLQLEATVKTLINRGFAYFDLGQPEQAVEDFTTVIKLTPDDPFPYNLRGVTHFHSGDYEAAIADFDAVLERDPGFLPAYNNRGNAYLLQRELELALADFDSVIARDPHYASAYNNRGNVHRALGDYDAAFADYIEALEIDSGFAEAWRNLGIAKFFAQDFEAAVDALNQVLTGSDADHGVDPALWRALAELRLGEDPKPALGRALAERDLTAWPGPLVRYLLGEIGEAALLAASADGNPQRQREKRVGAHFLLGQDALARGAHEDARRHFEAAVATDAQSYVEYLAAGVELSRL